jgi:two-component system chemotaxis response regulator CheY
VAERTCLVVEDSPMMRQLISFALSRIRNLSVTEAEDGIAGLKLVNSRKFDIVITDINMPIMDGLKLVRKIRENESYKDVPVVIVTTEGLQEDRDRALALGANAYITKPIQAPEVIETVKKLLNI